MEEINAQLAAGATIDDADQEGEDKRVGAKRLGRLVLWYRHLQLKAGSANRCAECFFINIPYDLWRNCPTARTLS